MSSEAPSNNSQASTARENKRSRTSTAALIDLTGSSSTNQQPTVGMPPTKTAKLKIEAYVVTLHTGMQHFLRARLEKVLSTFSAQFYKNKKYLEMSQDNEYVPNCCKDLGFPLLPVEEVRESEDFKALNVEFEVDLGRVRTELRKYPLRVHDMNRQAFWKRFIAAHCRSLAEAARCFVVQLDIGNTYGEHLACVDLLAKHPDEVTSPLNVPIKTFLAEYKEANQLAFLPKPTNPSEFPGLVAAIMGLYNRGKVP